jgi:hypothetical protein
MNGCSAVAYYYSSILFFPRGIMATDATQVSVSLSSIAPSTPANAGVTIDIATIKMSNNEAMSNGKAHLDKQLSSLQKDASLISSPRAPPLLSTTSVKDANITLTIRDDTDPSQTGHRPSLPPATAGRSVAFSTFVSIAPPVITTITNHSSHHMSSRSVSSLSSTSSLYNPTPTSSPMLGSSSFSFTTVTPSPTPTPTGSPALVPVASVSLPIINHGNNNNNEIGLPTPPLALQTMGMTVSSSLSPVPPPLTLTMSTSGSSNSSNPSRSTRSPLSPRDRKIPPLSLLIPPQVELLWKYAHCNDADGIRDLRIEHDLLNERVSISRITAFSPIVSKHSWFRGYLNIGSAW